MNIPEHHFYHILFIKQVIKASPKSKKKRNGLFPPSLDGSMACLYKERRNWWQPSTIMTVLESWWLWTNTKQLITKWLLYQKKKKKKVSLKYCRLFLSASDAYVRSFFYLLYTLIKLYYTHKKKQKNKKIK